MILMSCSGQSVLGYELRKKGAPHNCVDDACAAMKLVIAKIDKGFNDVIPAAQDDVSFYMLGFSDKWGSKFCLN